MINRKVCKKKYLSWVYDVDRKIRHSGSLFGITRLIVLVSENYLSFHFPKLNPSRVFYCNKKADKLPNTDSSTFLSYQKCEC